MENENNNEVELGRNENEVRPLKAMYDVEGERSRYLIRADVGADAHEQIEKILGQLDSKFQYDFLKIANDMGLHLVDLKAKAAMHILFERSRSKLITKVNATFDLFDSKIQEHVDKQRKLYAESNLNITEVSQELTNTLAAVIHKAELVTKEVQEKTDEALARISSVSNSQKIDEEAIKRARSAIARELMKDTDAQLKKIVSKEFEERLASKLSKLNAIWLGFVFVAFIGGALLGR